MIINDSVTRQWPPHLFEHFRLKNLLLFFFCFYNIEQSQAAFASKKRQICLLKWDRFANMYVGPLLLLFRKQNELFSPRKGSWNEVMKHSGTWDSDKRSGILRNRKCSDAATNNCYIHVRSRFKHERYQLCTEKKHKGEKQSQRRILSPSKLG